MGERVCRPMPGMRRRHDHGIAVARIGHGGDAVRGLAARGHPVYLVLMPVSAPLFHPRHIIARALAGAAGG